MQVARESIFISAIRSLINAFFAMIGILIGFVILMAVSTLGSKGADFGDPGKTRVIIVPDAEGNRTRLAPTAPVVLKVNIHGVIGSEKLNGDTIETVLLASQEGALKDGRVKAILLDIDSPGGSVTDCDLILNMLQRYKKKHGIPVYASISGICASGGVYISCAADKIYSMDVGIIGSVGVRSGPFFNLAQAMEKLGVSQKTFTNGKDKDMLNPFRKWNTDEGDCIQTIGSYDYARFVKIVCENRPRMDKEKLINVYGANVFDPEMAKEYGYIDEIGGYSQALTELVSAAKIEGEYQVIEIHHYPSFAAQLLESSTNLMSGKIKHQIDDGLNLRDTSGVKRLYLFNP